MGSLLPASSSALPAPGQQATQPSFSQPHLVKTLPCAPQRALPSGLQAPWPCFRPCACPCFLPVLLSGPQLEHRQGACSSSWEQKEDVLTAWPGLACVFESFWGSRTSRPPGVEARLERERHLGLREAPKVLAELSCQEVSSSFVLSLG